MQVLVIPGIELSELEGRRFPNSMRSGCLEDSSATPNRVPCFGTRKRNPVCKRRPEL